MGTVKGREFSLPISFVTCTQVINKRYNKVIASSAPLFDALRILKLNDIFKLADCKLQVKCCANVDNRLLKRCKAFFAQK